MRLVVTKYADGGKAIVETEDDGSSVIRVLEGRSEPGERISVYVEASCDNNEQGFDGLIDALSQLKEEAQRRRTELANRRRRPRRAG